MRVQFKTNNLEAVRVSSDPSKNTNFDEITDWLVDIIETNKLIVEFIYKNGLLSWTRSNRLGRVAEPGDWIVYDKFSKIIEIYDEEDFRKMFVVIKDDE